MGLELTLINFFYLLIYLFMVSVKLMAKTRHGHQTVSVLSNYNPTFDRSLRPLAGISILRLTYALKK